MPPTTKPIGAKEAAAILGVDESTISRYVAAGFLPSKRLPSGVRRFDRADVEALLIQSGDVPAAADLDRAFDLIADNVHRLSSGQRIRLASALTNAMTGD